MIVSENANLTTIHTRFQLSRGCSLSLGYRSVSSMLPLRSSTEGPRHLSGFITLTELCPPCAAATWGSSQLLNTPPVTGAVSSAEVPSFGEPPPLHGPDDVAFSFEAFMLHLLSRCYPGPFPLLQHLLLFLFVYTSIYIGPHQGQLSNPHILHLAISLKWI